MGHDVSCKHCLTTKAKQKKVQKESVTKKAKVPRNRLYLDLSIKPKNQNLINMHKANKKLSTIIVLGR